MGTDLGLPFQPWEFVLETKVEVMQGCIYILLCLLGRSRNPSCNSYTVLQAKIKI